MSTKIRSEQCSPKGHEFYSRNMFNSAKAHGSMKEDKFLTRDRRNSITNKHESKQNAEIKVKSHQMLDEIPERVIPPQKVQNSTRITGPTVQNGEKS